MEKITPVSMSSSDVRAVKDLSLDAIRAQVPMSLQKDLGLVALDPLLQVFAQILLHSKSLRKKMDSQAIVTIINDEACRELSIVTEPSLVYCVQES